MRFFRELQTVTLGDAAIVALLFANVFLWASL